MYSSSRVVGWNTFLTFMVMCCACRYTAVIIIMCMILSLCFRWSWFSLPVSLCHVHRPPVPSLWGCCPLHGSVGHFQQELCHIHRWVHTCWIGLCSARRITIDVCLSIDPEFDYMHALAPYQPLNMKVLVVNHNIVAVLTCTWVSVFRHSTFQLILAWILLWLTSCWKSSLWVVWCDR